jgi:hypothetical protein
MSRRLKLIGTYTPPVVRKGERVTCLYRDRECVVTGFHNGRIVWRESERLVSGVGPVCGSMRTSNEASSLKTLDRHFPNGRVDHPSPHASDIITNPNLGNHL